jgi:hypothetical protein
MTSMMSLYMYSADIRKRRNSCKLLKKSIFFLRESSPDSLFEIAPSTPSHKLTQLPAPTPQGRT